MFSGNTLEYRSDSIVSCTQPNIGLQTVLNIAVNSIFGVLKYIIV